MAADSKFLLQLKTIAREIQDLKRRIIAMERANQARFTSFTGTQGVYDADGNLVMMIGKQIDGTHTSTVVSGPIPPVPVAPTCVGGLESARVTWSGEFVDEQRAPLDFQRVEIHVGPIGFDATLSTNVYGYIESIHGQTYSITVPAGTYEVRLVTRSQSGAMSAPSDPTLVVVKPIPIVLAEDKTVQVSHTGTQSILLQYEPILNSEHVYWNGIYQSDTEWSRSGRFITLPDPSNKLLIGDELTVEYLYLDGQVIPPVSLTTSPGSMGSHEQLTATSSKEHVALPAGTNPGDLLVIVARGYVSASGNDTTTTLTCSDPRMSLAYRFIDYTVDPTGEAVAVFTGVADSSGAEIVIDATGNGGINTGAIAAIARFGGANGFGAPTLVKPGSSAAIPAFAEDAVVAVSWVKTYGFVAIGTSIPNGYTSVIHSGIDYQSVAISYKLAPVDATVNNQSTAVLLLPVV